MTHIHIYPYTDRYADLVQEWACIIGTLEIHVHTNIKVTDKEAHVALLETLTKLQKVGCTCTDNDRLIDSDVQIHLVWEDDF